MPSISAVDQATGRKFHWDDPDDITSVDQLTFLLSLHGGGSAVAWHGERETVALPETSLWAEKCGARPRVRLADVVDEQPGQIYETTRADKSNAAWGLPPRPGAAQLHVYPNARGGRVIADVVRMDKGHTEGLEPKVTQRLLEMMVGAAGGRARIT